MAERSASLDTLLADAGGGATRRWFPGVAGAKLAARLATRPWKVARRGAGYGGRAGQDHHRPVRRRAVEEGPPLQGRRLARESGVPPARPGLPRRGQDGRRPDLRRRPRRALRAARALQRGERPRRARADELPGAQPGGAEGDARHRRAQPRAGQRQPRPRPAQAAAHPGDGRHEGVHGRRGPRGDARRGGAADRAVRAHPVRAEHEEGARDAAAARPADDQQVLHRRRRAGPEHARVLRRRRPAVLHDLLAQPGRAPRRVGARRLRLRGARGARGGRDDHRLREVARDGAVRRRDHRELRGRPPRRDRRARADRRADARRVRARQRERRDGRRARRQPDGRRVGRRVPAQGLPRRPRAGGRVRVAAAQRPGLELLGQQLPAGQGPAGLRRPLLERATRRTCPPGCTATSWSSRSPTTSCGRASARCWARRSTCRRSRSTRTRWPASPTTSRRGRATTARRSCSAPTRASCSPPAGTSPRSSTRRATRRPATR